MSAVLYGPSAATEPAFADKPRAGWDVIESTYVQQSIQLSFRSHAWVIQVLLIPLIAMQCY